MIPSKGFCIVLQRVRQEKRTNKAFARTVGNYTCFWDGAELAGLNGQLVEQHGPGDNTKVGKANHLRIHEGTYRLAIQDGPKYRTFGYSEGTRLPKPGILVQDAGDRDGIVIHPGIDYVSSIGSHLSYSNR